MMAQSASIPQQMVGEEGTITLPFVGALQVRGLTPQQVGREIVRRLAGRAHSPQAVVRVVQNDSRAVTVLGEVVSNRRMPLTARRAPARCAGGGQRPAPAGRQDHDPARPQRADRVHAA